jgi:hypothetical protein
MILGWLCWWDNRIQKRSHTVIRLCNLVGPEITNLATCGTTAHISLYEHNDTPPKIENNDRCHQFCTGYQRILARKMPNLVNIIKEFCEKKKKKTTIKFAK